MEQRRVSSITVSADAMRETLEFGIEPILTVSLTSSPHEGRALLSRHFKAPFIKEVLARTGLAFVEKVAFVIASKLRL